MKNYREREKLQRSQRQAVSIAEYISTCDTVLEIERERINGAWPESVTIPRWPGRIERLALVYWLDELRAKAGKTIRIEFAPPLSGIETTDAIARLH